MISCSSNKLLALKMTPGKLPQLNELYKNLSLSLEILLAGRVDGVDTGCLICRTVLEEDLRDLLLECEEYLILQHLSESERASFYARAETVMDEVRAYFLLPHGH